MVRMSYQLHSRIQLMPRHLPYLTGTHSAVFHLSLVPSDPSLSPSTLSILRSRLGEEVTECCVKIIQAEMAVMMPHDVRREVKVLKRIAKGGGHVNVSQWTLLDGTDGLTGIL